MSVVKRASRAERLTHLAMIFHDAAVHDRDAINRMWMRVFRLDDHESSSACGQSYAANKRLTSELALEVS